MCIKNSSNNNKLNTDRILIYHKKVKFVISDTSLKHNNQYNKIIIFIFTLKAAMYVKILYFQNNIYGCLMLK